MKENFRAKSEYFKNKRDQEEEFLENVKEEQNLPKKYFIKPIPADFDTFELIREKVGIKSEKNFKGKKNSNFMGTQPRFPLSARESWAKKVENYNKSASDPIDPKMDPSPGPQTYSLVSHWPGKKIKKQAQGEKDERKPNFFKATTKGVSFKPYHSKF